MLQIKKNRKVSSFKENVLSVVKRIQKGSTLSYKEVSELAGSPKAYRVVGNILKANQDHDIPCHRVINSNGTLGKYNGLKGKSKKEILLKENAI